MLRSLLITLTLAVAVQADEWKSHSTTNFKVHHLQDETYGKDAGAFLEEHRDLIAKKWFGEAPKWRSKCDVYLFESHEHMMRNLSGKDWMAGCTNITYDGDQAVAIKISIRIDLPNCWEDITTHELMHALVGSHFGRPIPRWMDEGMCGQVESPNRIAQRRSHATGKIRYAIKALMNMTDYPSERRDVDVYYGQSITLVNHLVGLKGAKEFISFVRTSEKDGLEKALTKHYELDYDKLEATWLTAKVVRR